MRHIFASLSVCAAVLSVLSFYGDGAARADEPEFTESKTAAGGRLFRIKKAIVVPGHPQEPGAVYVLERTPLDWVPDGLEQDFLPRILKATGRHPF
jgi:hypothetical protein